MSSNCLREAGITQKLENRGLRTSNSFSRLVPGVTHSEGIMDAQTRKTVMKMSHRDHDCKPSCYALRIWIREENKIGTWASRRSVPPASCNLP